MVKLKIISFLLCMLMALQMLPLREIGKMLGTNQWTEELPHQLGDDEGKSDSSTPFQKAFLSPYNYAGNSILDEAKVNAYIHHSEQIPSNHSTEVVSPPPDMLA